MWLILSMANTITNILFDGVRLLASHRERLGLHYRFFGVKLALGDDVGSYD